MDCTKTLEKNKMLAKKTVFQLIGPNIAVVDLYKETVIGGSEDSFVTASYIQWNEQNLLDYKLIHWLDFKNSSFSSTRFGRLDHIHCKDCYFYRAKFTKTVSNSWFESSTFKGAIFKKLEKVTFKNCNLEKVEFQDTMMKVDIRGPETYICNMNIIRAVSQFNGRVDMQTWEEHVNFYDGPIRGCTVDCLTDTGTELAVNQRANWFCTRNKFIVHPQITTEGYILSYFDRFKDLVDDTKYEMPASWRRRLLKCPPKNVTLDNFEIGCRDDYPQLYQDQFHIQDYKDNMDIKKFHMVSFISSDFSIHSLKGDIMRHASHGVSGQLESCPGSLPAGYKCLSKYIIGEGVHLHQAVLTGVIDVSIKHISGTFSEDISRQANIFSLPRDYTAVQEIDNFVPTGFQIIVGPYSNLLDQKVKLKNEDCEYFAGAYGQLSPLSVIGNCLSRHNRVILPAGSYAFDFKTLSDQRDYTSVTLGGIWSDDINMNSWNIDGGVFTNSNLCEVPTPRSSWSGRVKNVWKVGDVFYEENGGKRGFYLLQMG